MENYINLKPVKRSSFRSFLGKRIYTYKRYLEWYLKKTNFASEKKSFYFENVIFSHKTPLYRKLKNVDMWLQENKIENLKLAIKEVNSIVIKPGEIFSYWKTIGKPTYKKGYRDGMILHYGSFKWGAGGGLCQLSNLLYWITLHSPLTVIERHRHSFDVFPDSNRTQPFGSGATCVYNYRDLQIKNQTNDDFQFKLWIDNECLHGELLSTNHPRFKYEIYEKSHEIIPQYWGAYVQRNSIHKKTLNLNNDSEINDEFICENTALMMYEPLLDCSN